MLGAVEILGMLGTLFCKIVQELKYQCSQQCFKVYVNVNERLVN